MLFRSRLIGAAHSAVFGVMGCARRRFFLAGAAGASTSATFAAFAGAAFAFRVVVVFFLVAMVLSRSPEPMRRFPPLSQAKSLYGCSPNRSAILVPDLAARKRNYTGDHLFFAQEVYPNRMICKEIQILAGSQQPL